MDLLSLLGSAAAIAANPVLGLAKVAIDLAPDVVRLFGGDDDAAATAEKIGGLVREVTGTSDPAEAAAKLTDPNLVYQLRMKAMDYADAEKQRIHEREMAAMKGSVETMQATLADVQNARARDAEIIKSGKENHRANYMIIGDIIGLLACLVFLYAMPEADEAVRTLVGTIAAAFALCLRDAHQFEFGSSRGSVSKDALLALSNPPTLSGK